MVGGETIADSRRALLLHESGHQPVYYFPPEDVRADLLEPCDRHTRCPKKGEASYHTIRVGDKVVEAGAWYYPEPLDGRRAAQGPDRVLLRPDGPLVRGGRGDLRPPARPLPPGRRARRPTATSGSRSTARCWPRATGRWRCSSRTCRRAGTCPREDVVAELEPTDTVTRCPYKGTASYYSVALADGEVVKDLIWYYDDPLAAVGRIAGLLCFFNERVDVELDGEPEGRPETAWKHGVKSEAADAAARSGSCG